MSEYDVDLEALTAIVEIQAEFEIRPFLSGQLTKYTDQILSSSTSKQELEQFLKDVVSKILTKLLSKQYIEKLKTRYYTDEGLQLLVFYFVYEKAIDYVKEKAVK